MNLLFAIKHFLKAKHRNGHGVHSPNIYEFFTNVLFADDNQHDYSNAELSLVRFKSNRHTIKVTTAGAKGSGKIQERKIKDIAETCSSFGKYGRLLQRISAYLKPKTILELGTSLGIGTIYLASGNKESRITTVEACPETSKLAKENFEILGLGNITTIVGTFDDVLQKILDTNEPFGLIYIDGNHTYEATKRYYEIICNHSNDETVIIFDDIDWSRGMSKAWQEIMDDPHSIVSIETLRMGIIFFNKKLTKYKYCTRY